MLTKKQGEEIHKCKFKGGDCGINLAIAKTEEMLELDTLHKRMKLIEKGQKQERARLLKEIEKWKEDGFEIIRCVGIVKRFNKMRTKTGFYESDLAEMIREAVKIRLEDLKKAVENKNGQ